MRIHNRPLNLLKFLISRPPNINVLTVVFRLGNKDGRMLYSNKKKKNVATNTESFIGSVAADLTSRFSDASSAAPETSRHLLLQAYSNVKPMLVVNFAASLCAAIVMSNHSAQFAYVWLGVMFLLTIGRWAALAHYRKQINKIPVSDPRYPRIQRHAKIVYGGGLLTAAILWNGLLYQALQTDQEATFFVTIIMAALAGGALGVSAPLKTEGRVYISALLLGGSLVMFISTNPQILMGSLAVIFWFVMIYGHNNNFNALRDVYTLQSTNQALVEELQALNTSLERKVAQRTEELERVALRDPLTDLPNRRGFREMLFNALQAADNVGAKVAVGVVDLDGFKPINDAFGHATGDELLIQVSQRLSQCLGNNNYIARLGGDEFGFIIPKPANEQRLMEIGNMICNELAKSFQLTGVVAEIGASVGISTYPDDTRDVEELCEKADYALYHAKQSRKGTATIFNNSHAEEIRAMAQMEQVLRQANFSEELYVVFQPITDIHSRRTAAFEALARWKSPVLGDVPPGLFIRAAEHSGQILQLTRHLLQRALEGARHLPADQRISVNLSARDIASMDAVHELLEIVKNSGVDPGRIVFEITETALVCDFEQAKNALHELHAIGTKIALDDFGTGHSSLSHLRLLPIDKLKIDSSFISDILTNHTSEDIVRTLIRLCDNMRIGCVIEGIETEAQFQKVCDLGGQFLQGYYFARPMPLVDVAAHLMSEQLAENPMLQSVVAKAQLGN